MKLSDLVLEIRKGGHDELARLEYGLERQVMDLEQLARLEKMQIAQHADEKYGRAAEMLEKELLGKACLECRKNTLRLKKEMVVCAIEQGIKKLSGEKKYRDFIKKEVSKNRAKGTLFYGNKNDSALKDAGVAVKPVKIRAGIIIKKGDVVLDKSIDALLEKNRPVEGKMQEFLFRGDKNHV